MEYVKAYENNPEYPGFIGLTSAPQPKKSFDKAVCLSDMRYFFEIAQHKSEFYWGITANLFLKKEAIGEIRFSLDHPKKGGGEDIAFCLEILRKNQKDTMGEKMNPIIDKPQNFKCVPQAEVEHPFWKENWVGYKRFFRWGYGDVILHKKFPKYRFHQYPNLIEFIFIMIIMNLVMFFVINPFDEIARKFFYFLLFSLFIVIFLVIWEISCEAIKLHRNNREFTLLPLLKAVLIRLLNDMGRFLHQMPRFWKITSRWDYFCTKESLKYERKNALLKFLGFLIVYICFILSFFIVI